MKDYEYLISQLNKIIGFLDVSKNEVYKKIENHDSNQIGITIGMLYDNNYEDFRNHICSSALLLGFAHCEDFLSRRLEIYFQSNPEENDFKFNFKVFKEKGTNLNQFIAEEQVRKLKFHEKMKIIKRIYNINDDMINELIFISKIRNCLMHNNGIAEEDIGNYFTKGNKIILDSTMVNQLGLKVRDFADIIK